MMKRRDFITLLGEDGGIAIPARARSRQCRWSAISAPNRQHLFASRSACVPEPVLRQVRLRRGPQRARSSIAGQRARMIDCRRWRPIWSVAQVDVHRCTGKPAAALAAKPATATIPIVFETGADPVGGRTGRQPQAAGRQHHRRDLAECGGRRRSDWNCCTNSCRRRGSFALLVNPANPRNAEATISRLAGGRQYPWQCELHVLHASAEGELDGVFAPLVKSHAGGLVIANETFFANRSERLAALHAPSWRPRGASVARIRNGRRIDELWRQRDRIARSGRCLCRADSQRREARRTPRSTAHEGGNGHQHENGESARHHSAALAARTRRSR